MENFDLILDRVRLGNSASQVFQRSFGPGNSHILQGYGHYRRSSLASTTERAPRCHSGLILPRVIGNTEATRLLDARLPGDARQSRNTGGLELMGRRPKPMIGCDCGVSRSDIALPSGQVTIVTSVPCIIWDPTSFAACADNDP